MCSTKLFRGNKNEYHSEKKFCFVSEGYLESHKLLSFETHTVFGQYLERVLPSVIFPNWLDSLFPIFCHQMFIEKIN